jgi:hypothetical protein
MDQSKNKEHFIQKIDMNALKYPGSFTIIVTSVMTVFSLVLGNLISPLIIFLFTQSTLDKVAMVTVQFYFSSEILIEHYIKWFFFLIAIAVIALTVREKFYFKTDIQKYIKICINIGYFTLLTVCILWFVFDNSIFIFARDNSFYFHRKFTILESKLTYGEAAKIKAKFVEIKTYNELKKLTQKINELLEKE